MPGVGAQTRRALVRDRPAEVVRRTRLRAANHRRVSVDRLEQTRSLRADVADSQNNVARELTLHFELTES